jgi:hypothetical protein
MPKIKKYTLAFGPRATDESLEHRFHLASCLGKALTDSIGCELLFVVNKNAT